MRALLYGDLNPLRAGRTEEYPWPSERAHRDGVDPSGRLDRERWGEICPLGDCEEVLRGLEMGGELRAATQAGNPYGDEGFVAELERQAGRSPRLKPPGPPPKTRVTAA